MPLKPTRSIAKENLVENVARPNENSLQPRPSVEQEIKQEGNVLIYVVNERAPWLWMVARDLYADPSWAGQIAKWNGLSINSTLQLGQKLRIEKKPTATVEEGTAVLIEYWRKAGNQQLVVRLGGGLLHEIKTAQMAE